MIRLALWSALIALTLLSPVIAPAVWAQEAGKEATGGETAVEEKPAPYDGRLERLSEILGAVHYLRNLCLKAEEDGWRQSMKELIDLEAASEPKRRERLTAAFNRGYRSFASVYTDCTPAAVVAEERYRIEGATLALEITARFGN